jgi:hypothetical protein
MSVYRQSIQAFVQLINSSQIPAPELAEFQQRLESLPEDDEEEIQELIEEWLENHEQLKEPYEQQLKALLAREDNPRNNRPKLPDGTLGLISLGPGGTKSSTPPNEPSESSKEMIRNSIQNSIQRRQ